MIRIKAFIKLYRKDDGRKTPFFNGYRPLFNFAREMKTSGQITLINKNAFYPGDERLVEIAFLNKDYLGDNFSIGTKFIFGEGQVSLGEGEVVEILE